jgi:hypothetical protein
MNGEAVYQEAQSFSPWVWGIVLVVRAILAGVLTMRLSTTVTKEDVRVRYGLLYSLRVPVSDIARAEALLYRPIRDYGGWGLRGSRKHRALNARGDRGVLITRRDGSTVMIGSQKPRQLLDALALVGVPTEDKLPIIAKEF